MNNRTINKMLESYKYEYFLIQEKMKELESNISKLQKNIVSTISTNKDEQSLNFRNVIESYLEEENKLLYKSFEKKLYVEKIIDALPQPYKTVMHLRYISFLSIKEVAGKMNYSTQRIYQLINEAFEVLGEQNSNESIKLDKIVNL